jgi:glyoxylase-like metal-dependent hydrolase (beta-lactamase superfamily II)
LQVAADGQNIFGLQIVATPDHTTGQIPVYDPAASVFITGDALAPALALGNGVTQAITTTLDALAPLTVLPTHVTDPTAQSGTRF